MRVFCTALLLLLLAPPSLTAANDQKDTPGEHALEQSQLTRSGSRPFHLKAKVVEATNPDNLGYNAEIEEFWVAPDKWRRVVKSGDFSQTLVVNGDKVNEQLSGDYYPLWLRSMALAILEPEVLLKTINESQPPDANPLMGQFGRITRTCRGYKTRVGIPPSNNIFTNFCFGDRGLLDSIMLPGYHAEYRDYKKFAGKQVARHVREYIRSGEELEASITELSELGTIDEQLFTVAEPSTRLQSIGIPEAVLRGLVKSAPEMLWPPVRGGKTKGVLSIFVTLDRKGRVRETYGLNSDHPDMTDAAMKQVRGWLFSPAAVKDQRVQVESILTFAYETKINDPYPVLNDEQSRAQAIKIVEAIFPPGQVAPGTKVTIRALINEDGSLQGASNVNGLGQEFMSAYVAVRQWTFRPYLRDGKPTMFNADVTFIAK